MSVNKYNRDLVSSSKELKSMSGSESESLKTGSTIKKKVPFLLVRNLPTGTTVKTLRDMCKEYGRVLDVRHLLKKGTYFVDCGSEDDMHAIRKGLLENSGQPLNVYIGGDKKSSDDKKSFKNQRPYQQKFASKPHYTNNNNSGEGVVEDKVVRNGNATHDKYYEEAYEILKNEKLFYNKHSENIEKIFDYLRKSSKITSETMNASGDSNKLGRCAECNKPCFLTCARCKTFFCGTFCQTLKWEEHSLICFPIKDRESLLKKSSSTKVSTNLENKTQRDSVKSSEVFEPRKTKTDDHKVFEPRNNKTDDRKVLGPRNNKTDDHKVFEPRSKKTDDHKVLGPRKMKTDDRQIFTTGYPLSGTLVVITAVLKTNVVFIRCMSDNENLKYLDIIKKVSSSGKFLKPLSSEPKIGQLVLAECNENIRRAMILSKVKSGFRLNYIDYGHIGEKSSKEIFEASEELQSLPVLPKPVVLKDVPETPLTKEILSYMSKYVDGASFEIQYSNSDYIENSGTFRMVLHEESSNHNLNEGLIKFLSCSEAQRISLIQPTPEEIFFEEDLEKVNLPLGKNIELVVMDNSMLHVGIIGCTTKENAREIQTFQDKINDYVESLDGEKSYVPRLHELCIAFYKDDDTWYRGTCIDVSNEDIATIFFLDYGNISKVHAKYIRRYPRHLYMKILTRECQVKGLPSKCSKELVERAEKLIPAFSMIACDEVEFDETHILTVNKIIKTLKSSNSST